MTSNKLYVSNLSPTVTEESLRAHFATCGGVCDVEMATTEGHVTRAGRASVTMTSETYTHQALSRLDGVMFHGRALRVSASPLKEKANGESAQPTVKIAQQFRERFSSAYDLDCAGTRLTVRMFPTLSDDAGSPWRLEARTSDAADAVVVTASGVTRREALVELGRWWREKAVSLQLPTFDWEGIASALRGVHAI